MSTHNRSLSRFLYKLFLPVFSCCFADSRDEILYRILTHISLFSCYSTYFVLKFTMVLRFVS